jgi:hypothetical protein
VTQDPQKDPKQQHNQPYDASLKGWITQQARAFLPILLPGIHYERTLNVEPVRPPMRVDRVFKVRYDEEDYLLHLEFEVGYDRHLKSRLLVYHSLLYREHHLPVLTIVVYPFEVKMARSPFRILIRNKPVLTFVFQTLALFHLNAKKIVQRRHTCMYALLPTMKHVNADLMEKALLELLEIYRDDRNTVAEQFVWMQVLLDRTTTVNDVKKEQIKARLNMFEQLFEESPTIQKIREQYLVKGRQEGLQEGLQKGQLLALQNLLVSNVQARYPELVALARISAARTDSLDALNLLVPQVINAPNADAVRGLLDAGTA